MTVHKLLSAWSATLSAEAAGVASGIGLLLAKEWARLAWLVTAIVLMLFHAVLLRLFYGTGEDLTQQLLNVVMIVFLVLISWTKLTQPSIKKLFR